MNEHDGAIELTDEEFEVATTIHEWDAEQQYEDLLDEVYGVVNIAGMDFDTGRTLRLLDPIAFRCGMLDYFDSEGIEIV